MSDNKTDTKDLQNKDLQQMVEIIARKINNSPALNGGFDKMMVIVEHIQQKQDETNEKIHEIYNGLYQPDDGLYARVKSTENEAISVSKRLDQHLSADEKLQNDMNSSFKKLVEKDEEFSKKAETTIKLKKIAGDDLEKLESVIKTKNAWLNIWSKIIWILGGGILAEIGKKIWEFLSHK
jgi:hypothetical protein